MNQEQVDRAKKLIMDAKVLSSLEKAEWMQLIPEMNDKQILDLIRILSPQTGPVPKISGSSAAAAIPSVPKAPSISEILAQAAPKPKIPGTAAPASAAATSFQPKVDIAQKELTTPVPFYEQELPQHSTVKEETPPPFDLSKLQIIPKQPKPAAPGVPAEKPEKPVSVAAANPIAAPKSSVTPPQPVSKAQPIQSAPVAAAAPAAKPQPAAVEIPDLASVARKETAPGPAPLPKPAELRAKSEAADIKLDFRNPEDFMKVSPNMLHGRDPYAVLQKILNSVTTFAKSKKSLPVVYHIEQSPLFVAYVNYGLAGLNDKTEQRELSREEFEAVADFRRELDKIVM